VSHPLGALWDSAPAISLEQLREAALRAALDALANQQYVSAAAELEASRDAARVLARMLQHVDSAAEAHQLANLDQTGAWMQQARDAAAPTPAPVITLRLPPVMAA